MNFNILKIINNKYNKYLNNKKKEKELLKQEEENFDAFESFEIENINGFKEIEKKFDDFSLNKKLEVDKKNIINKKQELKIKKEETKKIINKTINSNDYGLGI